MTIEFQNESCSTIELILRTGTGTNGVRLLLPSLDAVRIVLRVSAVDKTRAQPTHNITILYGRGFFKRMITCSVHADKILYTGLISKRRRRAPAAVRRVPVTVSIQRH